MDDKATEKEVALFRSASASPRAVALSDAPFISAWDNEGKIKVGGIKKLSIDVYSGPSPTLLTLSVFPIRHLGTDLSFPPQSVEISIDSIWPTISMDLPVLPPKTTKTFDLEYPFPPGIPKTTYYLWMALWGSIVIPQLYSAVVSRTVVD